MVKQWILLSVSVLCFTSCHTVKTTADPAIVTMNTEQFQHIIQNPSTRLIDVRTPEEYKQGHIPQAMLIDVNNKRFKKKIGRLNRENAVAVYCKGGVRSLKAAEILKKNGFKVYNLKDGFQSWDGRVEK